MGILTGLLLLGLSMIGDEDAAHKMLLEKGAKVVLSKRGVISLVEAGDVSKWTDDEIKLLGGLGDLENLSVGPGFSDEHLKLMAGLLRLETLQTNESRITDDGVKGLLPLKKLRTLKFFHPGKTFTGSGLAALAELPNLQSLTVAGSLAFGDEGMAAVATLQGLYEFRTWHAGVTIEGTRKLKALPKLRSLTLGQRLAYQPPTSVSDETVAVLVELKALDTLRLEEARMSLAALSRLQGLPGLKTLVLEGIELPEADVDKLRQQLPAAKVQWTKPSEAYQKRIQALFGNN